MPADFLDIKTLESIVKQMTENIDKSRGQIFEIAENARREFHRIQNELIETREHVLKIIKKIDTLEKEERASRLHLVEVSRNFTHYSENDIHTAYNHAKEIQVEISVLREKEVFLKQRRNDLERSVKRLKEIMQRAEILMAQVGMMLNFIGQNLQNVSIHIDKFQKRQQLGWWVIQAQEKERQRVAREIHDGTAQSLTNIFLRLEYCEKMWDQDPERTRLELIELKNMVRGNLQDLRRIIFDLRPRALDDLGLIPTLKHYIANFEEQYQIPVQLSVLGPDKRLQAHLEIALFRLIQEALANIRKHAEADAAIIKIEQSPSGVAVLIRDNGQGFDLTSIQNNHLEHYGLVHMRERAEIHNGEFRINTAPGKGTEIFIKIPLNNYLENFSSPNRKEILRPPPPIIPPA